MPTLEVTFRYVLRVPKQNHTTQQPHKGRYLCGSLKQFHNEFYSPAASVGDVQTRATLQASG